MVANTEIERLFGYDRAELVGQSPDVLVPDDVREQHTRHRGQYEHSPARRPMSIGMTLRGRRKDGVEIPVEISLSPRQTADGVLIMAAIRDISERLRLETERNTLLEAAQAQNERERIAMDLHDGVIQSIFGVGLGLEIAADEARDTPAEKLIDRSIDQLNDVIRDIRAYIFELRPMAYEGNLVDSLQHLAGAFRASSPIAIDLELEAGLTCTDDAVAVAVFQIAQEALANVRKHSQAKHAQLKVKREDNEIYVRISDDGVGFDTGAERADEHRGLRNFSNRADAIGGRIEVESSAGHGTTVSFAVPDGTGSSGDRRGTGSK
jgi:PAS domain S-box-containing protein